ncbi:MAG: AAA family ATPase [Planctomycetota bacterium]|nr:AAA family ATPase [Planctomycetota bacterium]MDA1177757.1 AAA family ATPase [Planctomycetota bacterium]
MRISDIEVEGFGIWSGLRLERLPEGITVFYGPNEAGKTTLLQFIRSVLYGFGEGRREMYLPPKFGGSWGGSLDVVVPSGAYRVERQLVPDGPHRERETLAIESNDGVRRGAQFLERLLCGIDETICTQVFAVGLHELQQLASLNATDAAEQLYGLATGRDRVSLHDVMRRVASVRKLLLDNHDSSRIQQLTQRRTQILQAVGHSERHAGRWDRLRKKWEEIEKQTSQLHAQRESCRRRIALIEACQQLREPWSNCQALKAALRTNLNDSNVPTQALLKLRDLGNQLAEFHKQKVDLDQNLKEIDPTGEFARLKRQTLVAAGSQDGAQKSPGDFERQYARLDDRARVLTTQLEEIDFEIQTEWEQSKLPGLQGTEQIVQQVTQLTPQIIQLLRPTARTLQQAERTVTGLKQQYESAKNQLQDSKQKTNAKAGLTDTDEDLYTAISRAGDLVSRLRRRHALVDDIRQSELYLGEIRSETNQWLERQLVPMPGLIGLSLLFGLGGLMTLAAMLGLDTGWWPGSRSSLWGVGLFLAVTSVVWKLWFQWSNEEGLTITERQTQRLRDRRQQIQAEVVQLDRELPESKLPLPDRLRQAEQELNDLEDLLAHDSERPALSALLSSLQLKIGQMEDAQRAANLRWQAALRTLGLHEEIGAEGIELLAEQLHRFQQLRERRLATQNERENIQRERDVLGGKIDRILLRSGQTLPSTADQRRLLLSTVSKTLAEQNQLRRVTQEKVAAVLLEKQRLRQSAAVVKQKQSAECIQYGIRSPKLVSILLGEQKRRREWQAQKKILQKQVHEAAKQMGCPAQRLITSLQRSEAESTLSEQKSQLRQQMQICEKKLEHIQEQRGAIQERLRVLQDDRTTENHRRELNAIRHDLRVATSRWKTVTAVGQMLEVVRERFERDRQPETLAEASVYLSRMTLGKYERIWTPFGEADLRIDTNENEAVSVEKLSRGTREQVFLALRLALAAAYGRRGTHLPVVLDDVLVNFDVTRARAAAEMLNQFAAQGNQVLVFTCHEHIRDIFRELGTETRELPRASEMPHATHAQAAQVATASVTKTAPAKFSRPTFPEVKRPKRSKPTDTNSTRSLSGNDWGELLFAESARRGKRQTNETISNYGQTENVHDEEM